MGDPVSGTCDPRGVRPDPRLSYLPDPRLVTDARGRGYLVLSAMACIVAITAGCSAKPATSSAPPPTSRSSTSTTPSAAATSAGCEFDCIPAGVFTTSAFLGGHLTLTFDRTWQQGNDNKGSFTAAPDGQLDQRRLLFWTDILPVDVTNNVVDTVPHTAAGFLAWLSTRANLQVSGAHRTSIGKAHLPATVVDIAIADDATNEAPAQCGTMICVSIFGWHWSGIDETYGIAGSVHVRLYLSDVTYNGGPHLFAVSIEAHDAADLAVFAPIALKVMASAQMPLTPAHQ
jgi:hypothetical protein